ncbi:class I SAM-dependent methyltransferase [Curvivirga sp.]|uniref:class I SAM-dependent methyltransferase n=1 Tax=Curvivirga sp. TaxID=2856848 RepID=UPI003B58FD12
MEKNAKFWNRIADKYAASPVPDEEIYKNKLRKTQEYLRPEMKVLEFGCGTGSTALYLASDVKQILATDISERMIEIAKQKADEQNISNIDFQQSSIEELTIADQSIDAALGHSILHLLENRDQVIDQIYAMLKPGGIFVSSTACIKDFFIFHKLLEWVGPLGRFIGLLPLVKVFGSDELKSAMTKSGFQIEYDWQPTGNGKQRAIFIIARKPEAT